MILLYPSVGFAVGVLVGLAGVGGGSLMTPLLVVVFGIHPAVAVGTDLLQVSITKAAGSLVNGFRGTVDWRLTRTLAIGSIPSTLITLAVLSHIGLQESSAQPLLTHILGVSLILTALTLLFRGRLAEASSGWTERMTPRRQTALTVGAGALIGFLVTMTSVGAGAIGTTILVMLYPRLPMARLVGSDIAHAVPLTFVAGAGHWMLGSIDWSLLMTLLVGSVPGIIVGSYFSAHTSDLMLRRILAVILAIVGARMII